MLQSWMAEILPPLYNVTQDCCAIKRRAARREPASAMCKHLVLQTYEHDRKLYLSPGDVKILTAILAKGKN